MATVLERVPQGGRALVIRLRSLGDCILSTPAIALLKQHRPDLHLAVVVEDAFRAVFEGNPDIEAILGPDPNAVRRWRPDFPAELAGADLVGAFFDAATTLDDARLGDPTYGSVALADARLGLFDVFLAAQLGGRHDPLE